MHIRASQGDVAGVEKLLHEGAEVNARDSEGCCALHWACDRGSLPVTLPLMGPPQLVGESLQFAACLPTSIILMYNFEGSKYQHPCFLYPLLLAEAI